ncbi:hypothetical protein LINPERPRIM_LOCUS23248 [Linum perenne]
MSTSIAILLFAMITSTNCITLKLVHHNSVFPPTAARTVNTSTQFAEAASNDEKDHMTANLVPARQSIYYVNFSIGQPPVPQLAVMAPGTACCGSNACLVSHVCLIPRPGSLIHQSPQLSNPSCNMTTNECEFKIRYDSTPSLEGILAKEQVTFSTWDGVYKAVPDILFGCCRKNEEQPRESHMTGVMGLGADPDSIVWRVGKPRFSEADLPPYHSY